jgi:anti-anti-sigma regulatory factor
MADYSHWLDDLIGKPDSAFGSGKAEPSTQADVPRRPRAGFRASCLREKSKVPITSEQSEAQCLIHLEGEISIPFAAEFKQTLVQALNEGKDLRIDMEGATELDITALQLLWVAEREAKKASLGFSAAGSVPEQIRAATTAAGFERFPISIEPNESSEV